ncbi:MAG: prepilin-type N-terminal cleavage/methylation domain-containing protein [Collimonas sp.]|uniref:type IV pilin protein n=1 Tax=Collimonas sp. TaxID=1963772 RepID=UPI003265F0FF
MDKSGKGFTLIELMVTVAIIAILSAIAYPNYADYVIRGYLVDATNGMSSTQAQLEQYYQDNRKYTGFVCASTFNNFKVNCSYNATGSEYTITADGKSPGPVSDFHYAYAYTVAGGLVKTTSGTKSGWGNTCATAWIVKKGQCT